MEEEMKGKKISASVVLLIIALIVIVVMGVFMFKLFNDKKAATDEVAKLNNQVNTLQDSVNSLRGTIDNVSNAINNSKNTENSKSDEVIKVIDEQNKLTVKYDFDDLKDIEEDKVLNSLKINGIEYKNKIETSGNSVLFANMTIENCNDFLLINITEYTTGANKYNIYVFDMNGNYLWKALDMKGTDMFHGYSYHGEYSYNKNEKSLTYKVDIDYDETAGGYLVDAERFDALTKAEKEKLAKETDYSITYKIKYLGNGKFSEKEQISSTKLIDNENFVKNYINK